MGRLIYAAARLYICLLPHNATLPFHILLPLDFSLLLHFPLPACISNMSSSPASLSRLTCFLRCFLCLSDASFARIFFASSKELLFFPILPPPLLWNLITIDHKIHIYTIAHPPAHLSQKNVSLAKIPANPLQCFSPHLKKVIILFVSHRYFPESYNTIHQIASFFKNHAKGAGDYSCHTIKLPRH